MTENKNLFLAIVLSMIVIVSWRFWFESDYVANSGDAGKSEHGKSVSRQVKPSYINKDVALDSKSSRVFFENEHIKGSLKLNGLQFDNLTLKDYKISVDDGSTLIDIMSPEGTLEEYFSEFGWASGASKILDMPDANTLWEATGGVLSPENPVTLSWCNKQGALFKVALLLDNDFMFHIEQSVMNRTDAKFSVVPYARIKRVYNDFESTQLILHEGPVGFIDGKMFEFNYRDILNSKKYYSGSDGKDWFGFSNKYWASLLIPMGDENVDLKIQHAKNKGKNVFQISFVRDELEVEPGETKSVATHLFIGAKDLKNIDQYSKELEIPMLDRVVDFGRLYFITKPVFVLLQYFYALIGNFGLAILLLTICVKLLMLPLSIKSYVSMLRMRELQPEVNILRESYKDDKTKLQQQTLVLFKKHGVNPAAGCLPMLLQIPVFFSLYKVLFITLAMRHAPFFGWIKDLSALDSSSVLTLFGLLHWDVPQMINIGVLPVILGITMVLQQKLNAGSKSTANPMHNSAMKVMPYVLTFLFASFPAGLIIYWIWNNILSITQQFFVFKCFARR